MILEIGSPKLYTIIVNPFEIALQIVISFLLIIWHFRATSPPVEQVKICHFLNSTITMISLMTSSVISVYEQIGGASNAEEAIIANNFVATLYYMPFLWIISVYVSHFAAVQTWFQRARRRAKVREMRMQVQMTHTSASIIGFQSGATIHSSVSFYSLRI
ncbi:unnamed protein product [Caenorhabditis sp. 36 PRJEB53466]|nr:unnamed protein product [Caenorhabditis sp. 36 PRJEB53466]